MTETQFICLSLKIASVLYFTRAQITFQSNLVSISSANDFIFFPFILQGPLKPGLYLVGTPIGNLEDITLRSISFINYNSILGSELVIQVVSSISFWFFNQSTILGFNCCRALRVLKSADVILSEDTRHSGKLLQYYNIKTPLVREFCFPIPSY